MSSWFPLFLLVWFLGTCAGTTFAILLVRAGSRAPAESDAQDKLHEEEEAA